MPVPIAILVPVAAVYQVIVPLVHVAESVTDVPAQTDVLLTETDVGNTLVKSKGMVKVQVPSLTLA